MYAPKKYAREIWEALKKKKCKSEDYDNKSYVGSRISLVRPSRPRSSSLIETKPKGSLRQLSPRPSTYKGNYGL
jgi:hypothetical protein